MCWWIQLGYPSFEEGKGGFPRTGQVIKYYREKNVSDAGHVWTQKEFAKVLAMTEKTVGEIENRDATLEFDRRQLICQLFDIPPLLLGIRTLGEIQKLVEQEGGKHTASVVAPYWWISLGYPSFAPGSDGFPRIGQVVRHYRNLKKDETGKAWIQRDLAQALGISDQAAWDLENRDAGMGDMDRRRAFSRWFAIPPTLLGIRTLDEVRKMAEEKGVAEVTTRPVIISSTPTTSHKLCIDVNEYESLLTDEWRTFISDPVKTEQTDVFIRMDALYRELPHIRDAKPIYELLCRYHDFLANVLRDKQKYHAALEQCQKALRFAQLLHSDEMLAFVLYEWGYTLWQADRLDEARQKYEEARCYEQALPNNLRGCLLLDAGRAEGEAAQTKEAKKGAIALVDRIENLICRDGNEADPYFLTLTLDRYHLTRSATLLAIGRNKDAINELRLVEAGPLHPRRQACHEVYLAQAYINLGKYDQGVALAEAGLAVAQKVVSEVIIARIEKLHQKLAEGPYKGSPDVARLDLLLGKTGRER